MDFFIGLGVGILVTLIAGAGALYFFLRDNTSPLPQPLPAKNAQPVVTVMLVESFLNQQLRDALANQNRAEPVSASAPAPRTPFRIQLHNAALDVQPERRARFVAQITAHAWNLNVTLNPVAELEFLAQAGRVKILVGRVQVHGVTVPRALIDTFLNQVVATAEEKMNHSLAQLREDTRVELAELESTDDLMILKFASGT